MKKYWYVILIILLVPLCWAGFSYFKSTSGQPGVPTPTESMLPSGIVLPPEPGEAGKATLAGIDSDGDGVRYDVERYIALTYPSSQKTRVALRDYAIVTQQFLLDAADKQASLKHAKDQNRAVDCLFYIRPSDTNNIRVQLRAQLLNTDSRSRAYLKADSQLSGQILQGIPGSQKKTQCGFDPDALPN